MKKLALFVAALVAVPAMFAASVFADSPGQLSNGSDNYQVKNVTQNGAYGKTVAVKCNDVVKYSVLMSNSDFGQLNDVTVKTTLPGSITISAKNSNNETQSVSGTVTVSLPSNGKLAYVSGTTNYYVYNSNGTVQSSKTLADGVAASGINTGTLAGSTTARVYFQAKVNCEDKPVVKNIKVCEVASGNIVTIKEDAYDSSKYSKDMSDCDEEEVAAVTELPKTGTGSVMLAGLGLGALVIGGAYALQRRNILG